LYEVDGQPIARATIVDSRSIALAPDAFQLLPQEARRGPGDARCDLVGELAREAVGDPARDLLDELVAERRGTRVRFHGSRTILRCTKQILDRGWPDLIVECVRAGNRRVGLARLPEPAERGVEPIEVGITRG
jgi:hypothetical protein